MKKMRIVAAVGLGILFSTSASAYEVANERTTITAWQSSNGDTVAIPESTIIDLCGDWDGCEMRFGTYRHSDGRTVGQKSRTLYYNATNKNWYTSNDNSGTNNNGVTQHVYGLNNCYFTDGEYIDNYNRGDFNTNFGLMAWSSTGGSCKLTLID